MSPVDPLPPEITALLERARDGAPIPGRELEDAVLRRVRASVNGGPNGDGPGDSGPAGGASGGAGASAGGAVLAPLAIGIIVALAVGGSLAIGRDGSRPQEATAVPGSAGASDWREAVLRPQEPTRRQRAVVSVHPELSVPDSIVARATVTSPPATTASKAARGDHVERSHQARTDDEDALAAEAALLEVAAAALREGELGTATERLDMHARRYARGQLTEEREVMRVRVAFAGTDVEAARAAAEAFLARFPRSAHRPALEQMRRPR